jgi:hypothetical protein
LTALPSCGKMLGQNHFAKPNWHVFTLLHPIFFCQATYWAPVELLLVASSLEIIYRQFANLLSKMSASNIGRSQWRVHRHRPLQISYHHHSSYCDGQSLLGTSSVKIPHLWTTCNLQLHLRAPIIGWSSFPIEMVEDWALLQGPSTKQQRLQLQMGSNDQGHKHPFANATRKNGWYPHEFTRSDAIPQAKGFRQKSARLLYLSSPSFHSGLHIKWITIASTIVRASSCRVWFLRLLPIYLLWRAYKSYSQQKSRVFQYCEMCIE